MSEPIYTQQGKFVVDSSFIPYMRRQDVVFEAENLRPGKIAKIFFDEVVINQFCQKGNQIIVDSRKVLTVSPNTGGIFTAGDYVYQGSSSASPTFRANVYSYDSSNRVVTLYRISGDFDEAANISCLTGSTLKATASINSFYNEKTSDTFDKNEGVICQNNNVYMTVIGASGENALYVNENYINLRIDATPGNTLSTYSSTEYAKGDIVYQTTTGAADVSRAIFRGVVEYFNKDSGGERLAVTPTYGTLMINESTSNVMARIWNASQPGSKGVQARSPVLVDLTPNNVISSVSNLSKSLVVTSYNHSSGIIANISFISADSGGANLYLNSSNTGICNGNILYITSGTGLGQFKRVIEVSGKRVKLAGALSTAVTQLSKYSVGNHIVDSYGNLTGVFNIPEEPVFKFKTGERVFTITDTDRVSNNEYSMRATSKFTASGILNRTQRIVTTPSCNPLPEFEASNPIAPVSPSERTFNPDRIRVPTEPTTVEAPRRNVVDPIAQTFFTPKPTSNKINNGIFVTSVDLFFSKKPSTANGSLQLPITVKIATVVNGFPTQNYVATKTIQSKDVKVSTTPSASDSSTLTKFTFPDPVYLLPDSEYALIVMSDSPEYELYTAEIGGEVLGADPPRRISEQPYAGSFFKAQNSSTWAPYNNEDLMFVVNKAVFQSSGTLTMNLKDSPTFNQNVHRLFLHTNELTFPVGDLKYKVKGVFASNSSYEPGYNYISPQKVFRYGSLLDASNKADSVSFANSRKINYGNSDSIIIQAEFSTSDTDISPIFNMESLTLATGEYLINNAELSNNIISIVNRGAGYNASPSSVVYGSSNATLNTAAQTYRTTYLNSNANIGFYNLAVSGGMGSGADGFAVANTDGSNTISFIVINSPGSGYVETPNVSLPRPTLTSSNANASVIVQGETGKSGGNFLSRYITRQFSLEDGFESGDLRVFMDVVRPNGTDIQVYFKVLGIHDNGKLSDKNWVRMTKRVDKKSKDEKQIVELEFKPDTDQNMDEGILQYTESGIKYPIGGTFKTFSIKVGLLSSDPAVIPLVKNLRIIATPAG
jgi:hypothetical protein